MNGDRFHDWRLAIGAALLISGCGGGVNDVREAPQGAAAASLEVVSSRPDAVSGGDALVKVSLPPGAAREGFRVTSAGRDVTASFKKTGEEGVYLGLIDGLPEGVSFIELSAAKGKGLQASLTVLNHRISGPVVSGQPQQQLLACATEAAGLGAALDADCSAETKVDYQYKSTDGSLKPYNPAAPRPSDMDTTVDADGKTVDFIIRRERGTINRAIYEFRFRHVPGTELPNPWSPSPGWNGKAIFAFGGDCRAAYVQQPSGADVFNPGPVLGAGYAVMNSSLNVFGNDCNDVRSAETASMVKEKFIEKFGVPLFTMGHGASGGSMQQHLIAQNYPGILDGILPSASYPDLFSIIPWVSDCRLLNDAIEMGGLQWTDAQKTAVSGFATWNTCTAWINFFSTTWIDPKACRPEVPADKVYDAVTNPTGVRCTIADNMVNQVGVDPATGFARRALDNVGVEYGVAAFNAGIISAEQFVSLNEHAGGFDANGNVVAQRTLADTEALRNAYARGRVNTASGGLANIPIIDYRPYLDPIGDIHDGVRSLSTRARLAKVGAAANQVIWMGPTDLSFFFATLDVQAVRTMDAWLTNLKRDVSNAPMAERIARAKPAEAVDACWTASGERIVEVAGVDAKGRCGTMYPLHKDPRQVAGAPVANDVLKCQLRSIDRSRYAQPLSDAQWARLQAAFPQGVCDYSLPGVEQQTMTSPWIRY